MDMKTSMDKRVAIIGYSFRLPQTSTENFWQDLLDNKDLITEVDPGRWSFDSFLHPDKQHAGSSYTFKAGTLGNIAGFDADFFGISPREAAVMDPQQRHLLEMTNEAIEHAGIKASTFKKSDTGVFFGVSSIDYSYRMSEDLSVINSSTATGNTSSIASNRISYTFDLKGPSISMDTACSSTLVAFHQACQAILSGEITTALTGGISLHLHPFGFIIFSKATMLSPDGRCKVFDESANGYVRSEGGGVFLLKDYDQAKADGDRILAIVAASAVNTDGNKSGITIPSCHAQAVLMEKACQQAGIEPEQIDYIEAHGTGTPVGDPIETRAIGNAIGRKRSTPIPIGSVKSNLGHLETASAVASLVKSLLILQHRSVPATISMKTPNPDIKFDEWNIKVVDQLLPLKADGTLTVGINSFGFGGANAHVILQSDESDVPSAKTVLPPTKTAPLPLTVSGKNEQARHDNTLRLIEYLKQNQDTPFYDIAWNYNQQKEQYDDALFLFAKDSNEAINHLTRFIENDDSYIGHVYTGQGLTASTGPVFVYSGNGCQWETMGKSLLQSSDVFARSIAITDELFSHFADFSLIDEIKGLNGKGRFEHTEIAQPALFAIQVGITEHLRHQGIIPVAVTGHSVGEVAAAWACGALSLADAVKVIYFRSLYQGMTKGLGAMTAAAISEDDAEQYLQQPCYSDVYLAGINSHKGVTLAGNPQQLEYIEQQLSSENIFNLRLPLDYAFHSPMMDSVEQQLRLSLAKIKPQQNTITYVSTVTGTAIEGTHLNAEYWWQNIRKPVLFKHSIDYLLSQKHNCFVEIGAHPVLRSYQQDQIRQHNVTAKIIPTITRNKGSEQELAQCVANIFMAGAVNLDRWFPTPVKRLELPLYAWQHEDYWYPATVESLQLLNRYSVHPLLGAPLPHLPLHWENQLDTARMPWLADHKVGDSVVYPGAGFIELALNAASLCRQQTIIEIEEFEILGPLILEEGQSKVVRTQIESTSGDIRISSRSFTVTDQWTQNCKARAPHQTTGQALQHTAPVLPDTTPDFNASTHQQLALLAGLQYGPAFSAVKRGWIDENEILAELNMPDSISPTASQYLLHPGILDSAIQLVIHFLTDELSKHKGTAFIPARADRILIDRQANTQPTLARLTLLRKAPHSLLTKIELFDAAGHTIAILEGVRFKAVRLYKTDAQEIAFLNYHLTPAPAKSNIKSHILTPLNQAINQAYEKQQHNIRRYNDEVAPLLESLITHAMAEAVLSLSDKEQSLAREDLEILNLQDPDNRMIRDQFIKSACEYNVLIESDTGFSLSPDFIEPGISSHVIWNALLRDYPEFFSATHLAGRTSLFLDSFFKLDKTGESISSEQHSDEAFDSEAYLRLFKDLLTQTSYPVVSQALKALITEQQNNLKPGERLRILEVASSHCYFGQSICSAINFDITDYTFASNNDEALDCIEHLRDRYPLAMPLKLDQTEAEPYQLVVLTFDDYRSHHCLEQLQRIKPLLAENTTVLICGMQPSFWLDFALGRDKDWWSGDQSGQVSDKQWLSTLESQSFSELRILSTDAQDNSFFLISGCFSNRGEQKLATTSVTEQWLIVAGDTPKEINLATKICNLNPSIINTFQTADELRNIIFEAERVNTPITRIILLQQIGNNTNPLKSQTLRCTQATNILQTLEAINSSVDVWLITQGVGATLPCDQVIQITPAQQTPADAALWGFGRTLMNESLNNQVRLLDLPTTLDSSSLDTLLAELQSPSNEHELFIAEHGQRFAPRLRRETLSLLEESAKTKLISLGFELPGQLRNLQWQSRPTKTLNEDEVEIEVKATGLNFRDIMYALGLLSDEAIENGFAGATMGLEFSGQITKTGENVNGFNVGDNVVGFGSACFSNKITATSYSIAHIPAGLSYESAATIPTTFLTVYYALHHLARLQPGEKILIHGAAGGVGIAAIQIAQWIGAEIYATVGSNEKHDFLELMGIPSERIFNSRTLTFAEEILQSTDDGKGVDVVLNSLAGEAINQNFRALKPFGRFLELGKRDFYENTPIGLRPFRNNISYFGIDADQLQLERPELTSRLFTEMLELFDQNILFPLPYTKFNAHEVVDAFRYMQQAKQIGKIIVTYDEGLTPDTNLELSKKDIPSLKLDPQGSYLVTGGLGGFGLKTAQWLTTKGAKQLILLSRRGASSEEASNFLNSCQSKGISVHIAACDVTEKESLQGVINLCGKQLPPLKGVVHAATVINDSLIRNLDGNQIETSMAAKLCGAQYLDELTRNLDLDIFILYSSVTTLLGNPGQAAYVAANHWLEALTATRQALQLPATCVRWGAIDDVGFLSRNLEIKDALQNRLGGNALNSDIALDILEQIILTNSQQLGVLELDWHALSRFLPTATHNKFRELVLTAREAEQNDEDTLDLEEMMQTMSESEFHSTIVDILIHELSEILMISTSKISPEKSIYDMGMDSLMGVELMSALESRIGIKVPVMALTETPKLSQLADKIIDLVKNNNAPADNESQVLVEKIVSQHGATDSNITTNIVNSLEQATDSTRIKH